MAKKKSSKVKEEKRTSLMFPSLHEDVVNAISDHIVLPWFYESEGDSDSDSDEYSNNEYSTHVMGYFRCRNKACSKTGWYSKKVAILIRGYPKNGYNASVFNQRCKSCDYLGTMKLDTTSYVERVVYRLKKWAGLPLEEQTYTKKKGLPHRRDLCEGCKRGICGL